MMLSSFIRGIMWSPSIREMSLEGHITIYIYIYTYIYT
jgi:hypothetical protein